MNVISALGLTGQDHQNARCTQSNTTRQHAAMSQEEERFVVDGGKMCGVPVSSTQVCIDFTFRRHVASSIFGSSTMLGMKRKQWKFKVCGTKRRKISWFGKCSKCAKIVWKKRKKAGNRKKGPEKRQAALWGKAKQCPCLAATLTNPPDLSVALNEIVKPGKVTQRWVASRLRAALAIALRGLAIT